MCMHTKGQCARYSLQWAQSYISAKSIRIFTKIGIYGPYGLPSTKYYSHCGCVLTCTHTKGHDSQTTLFNVHNHISQLNEVRWSPNLKLMFLLGYQAQNIIHIVGVCTHACTQKGQCAQFFLHHAQPYISAKLGPIFSKLGTSGPFGVPRKHII